MYKKAAFFTGLGLLVSTAAASPFSVASRQTTCTPGVHMMIAGGCEVPCVGDIPDLLSTLIGNITQIFPGSDQYYVPYNGSPQQAVNSTPVMIAAAMDYAQACPQTPIVFIGYSLGGIIIMNTMCGGISTSLLPNVLAAISYGEETYAAGQVYNAGTCTQNAPKYARNNTAACQPYASKIQDYCNAEDPDCCSGGVVPAAHFQYPMDYDYAATCFVVKQYNARVGSAAKTCPSPTSTVLSSTVTMAKPTSTSVSTTPTSTSIAMSTKTSTIARTPSSSSSTTKVSVSSSKTSTLPLTTPSHSISTSTSTHTTIVPKPPGTTTTSKVPPPTPTSSSCPPPFPSLGSSIQAFRAYFMKLRACTKKDSIELGLGLHLPF